MRYGYSAAAAALTLPITSAPEPQDPLAAAPGVERVPPRAGGDCIPLRAGHAASVMSAAAPTGSATLIPATALPEAAEPVPDAAAPLLALPLLALLLFARMPSAPLAAALAALR